MQKSANTIEQRKDKQYLIKIPEEIANAGQIIGAVYAQFGESECLIIFNHKNLFFLEIANQSVIKYSSYNMSNINSLESIIKGYLLITTKQKKLWLFELKKMQKKMVTGSKKEDDKKVQQKQQQKILTVQSYLKQIPYHSYSLREVTPNMVELFLSTEDEKNNRIIYIYQFTIKQKVGGMAFTVDKNNRIIKQSRKQLYASKSYYDPSIRSLIKLKNFSDNNFVGKKIYEEYMAIIPVCKGEQYYGITKNTEMINLDNSSVRRNFASDLQGFSLKRQIIYLNYLLLENNNGEVGLFSLQESALKFLGKQSYQYHWKICFNGKLVGIHNNNLVVKITKQLNRKNQRLTGEQLRIGQMMQIKDQKNLQEQKSIALQTKQVTQKTKQSENTTFQQKGIQLAPQEKELDKNSQPTQRPNQNENVPAGQLDTGRQKPIFKPTKIIGRKDLNKEKSKLQISAQQIKPLIEQKNGNKDQKTDQKSNLTQQDEKKKVQHQSQKTQHVSHQNITEQNQKGNISSHRKKQNINLLKLSENFFNAQSNSRSLFGQSKIQTILNNQSETIKTGEKNQQKVQLKNQEIKKDNSKSETSENKNPSPFSKKTEAGSPGESLNQPFIPTASFNQIFGSKPVNCLTIFSKDNRKSGQIKVSPFKKKQSGLEIENNSSLNKQQKQQKIEQFKQLQKDDDKKEKIQEKEQQIATQSTKQIEDNNQDKKNQNCCNNFVEVRQSYQFFSQKVATLETKTTEMKDQLQKRQESLINCLSQSYKRSLNEIIEASLQKSQNEIAINLQNSVNDYMSKKLAPRVNDYFKNVMTDSKKIYDTTQKFYSDKNKQSLGSMRYHFQQQEHLLSEIKLATSDMLACVQNTIHQGEQSHAFLLKQWQRSVQGVNKRLDKNLQRLENHTHDRSASERQKIIDILAQLKQDLINQKLKSNKQATTDKEKKEKKEKKVIKDQKERKQNKNKTKQRRQKHLRQRQGYYLPMGPQNPYYYPF